MDAMPHTSAMWAGADASVRASAKHPFLLAMLDGTLQPSKFEYYIRQDSKYLLDFGLALRRLAALAGDEEEALALNNFADGADIAERSLHASFFAAWGLGEDALAKDEQAPTTLAYTSFLLRCVADGYREGLAALLPCFWVYHDVGVKMLELRATTYRDATRAPQLDAWIDMYGGDAFADAVYACTQTQMQLYLQSEKVRGCPAAANACRQDRTCQNEVAGLFHEYCEAHLPLGFVRCCGGNDDAPLRRAIVYAGLGLREPQHRGDGAAHAGDRYLQL